MDKIINRYINRNINFITSISALFLIISVISKWININSLMIISLILASIISGIPIILRAYSALKFKTISIELLVSIAIIAAFIIGEFFESAMVSFLFLFGNFLENKTINKTRSAIQQLTKIQPNKANVLDSDKNIKTIDSDEVVPNNLVIVKTGEQIPVDGIINNGSGHLDESKITGESRPINKHINDRVYSGSILHDGSLIIKATKVGDETTLGKMSNLVEEAQDNKSHIENFIDKFAKYYTPTVLIVALITFFITQNLRIAVTLLVLGCPGALIIGAPVSNVAGIGNGSKNSILIKGGETINKLSKIDTIVFDKTGTLTKGKMHVLNLKNYSKNKRAILKLTASIEKLSKHPLAQAIVNYAQEKKIQLQSINNKKIKTIKGMGIAASINNDQYLIGNEKLLDYHQIKLSNEQIKELEKIKAKGNSSVIITKNNLLQMILGIADEIRPNAKKTINKLKNKKFKKIIMLTGDNEKSAKSIANATDINEVYANLLPEQKMNYLNKLKEDGYHPAFVGDGINDSPSLATANVGIAIGSGTDIAINTADVVLVSSKLNALIYAIKLSKKTIYNIKENITIAILTVVLLLIGLIIGLLNMASGMFFHEVSILIVIINAIRLTYFKST